MKTEIKQKWCAALESQKYTQCQGVLKKKLLSDPSEPERIGYCCLGVLCEELMPEKFVVEYGGYDLVISNEYGDRSDTELPESVLEEIGLSTDDMNHLITMNDDDGYTFTQIAQYIRSTL